MRPDPAPAIRDFATIQKVLLTLAVGTVLAFPCHAGTVSIGPSIGFDMYSANGSSSIVIAAPAGNDLLFGGLKPGLRLGLRDATGQNTVFTDLSMVAFSGSGFSLHTFSGTLNYARAFREGSSPYITGGLGFSNYGGDGYSETAFLVGGGVGFRKELGHGNGAVRLEGRYDRASSADFSVPLNILGLRVGFDLDLM